MKYLTRISIVICVICLLFTLTIYAAETSVNISSRVSECKVNNTFDVVISFECEEDFKGLTGNLEYDKTKLKLEKATSEGYFKELNGENSQGKYVVSVLNNVNASENMTITDGQCQTITFKVLEEAKNGETLTIKLSDIQIKTGETKETIEEKATTVKIVSETENPADKDPEEDNPSDGKPEGDKPTGGENNPNGGTNEEQKPPKHENAGLEDYTFVFIVVVAFMALVSFIKYKKYRNI